MRRASVLTDIQGHSEGSVAVRRYTKGIWGGLRYLANWLPNAPMEVGDIGLWSAETGFTRTGSLKARGMAFKSTHVDHAADLTHRAVASARVTGDAKGEVADVLAGVEFEFGTRGQFVFQAGGCRSTRIEGCESLLKQMVSQFRDGVWEEELVVVSEVVRAERATILLSSSPKASISLTGPQGLEDLLTANLRVRAEKGTVTQILAESGLTPLFKALKVDGGWFRRVRAREVTFEATLPEPEIVAVTPDDLG